MKGFEQQIRDAILGQRVAVDPAHVDGFKAFLEEKKRRRRGLIIWLIGGLIVVSGSLAFLLPKKTMANDEPPRSTSTVQVAPPATFSPQTGEDQANLDERSKEAGTVATHPNTRLEADVPDSLEPTATGEPKDTPHHIADAPDAQGHHSALEPPLTPTSSEQGAKTLAPGQEPIIAESNQPPHNEPNNAIEATTEARSMILPPTAVRSKTSLLEAPERALIDPIATLSQSKSRLGYGVVGSWFRTQPTKDSRAGSGIGYQLGGFVTMPLSPAISAQLEGGFMHLDGGFAFDKQSVTTQYGFTQRSQSNTLTVRKMYSWYGGASLLARKHRHIVEVGVQGYHVYGAKGDITKTVIEGAGPAETVELEDVWVSTGGLRDINLESILGYRYRVNQLLDVALRARLPLSGIQNENSGTEYALMANKYGWGAQIALYYNLNR